MEALCRTCMSGSALRPLFPYISKRKSFERALYLCTKLRIGSLDGLPQFICKLCSKFVESAVRFRNKSHVVQNHFMQFLKCKRESDGSSHQFSDINNKAVVTNSLHKLEMKTEYEDRNMFGCKINVEKHYSELGHYEEETSKPELHSKKTKATRKLKTKDDKQYLELIEGPINPDTAIKCKICFKIFSTLDIFKGHAKCHIGPDLLCEYCGKKQRSNITLLRHQRAKHGLARDDRFPCSFCDYRALDKEQLEGHERHIHTKERPFVCDECGEAFYSKRVLIQHGVIHKPDKPFQCDLCPMNFKSRSRLTGHVVKVHKRICKYSYGCIRCPKRYGVPADARYHMAKSHGIPKEQQGKVPRFNLLTQSS